MKRVAWFWLVSVAFALAAHGVSDGPAEGDAMRCLSFGYAFDTVGADHFELSDVFNLSHLDRWFEAPAADALPAPLPADKWSKWAHLYNNEGGLRNVATIREWIGRAEAAGLAQDGFRSLDNGHSSIQPYLFPQLNVAPPVGSVGPRYQDVFPGRITMGVQSYGHKSGASLMESRSIASLRAFFESPGNVPRLQHYMRALYENNFVFVAPATGSYRDGQDRFTTLSPFYLHSIGASGTDAKLIAPLLLASAALPPQLKTRILRQGLFAPTMMYLFKSSVAKGIESPEAHVPAYAVPEEVANGRVGPTPFLDKLVKTAHDLDHIPPVCRMYFRKFSIATDSDEASGVEAYYEINTYGFAGVLRHGQSFVTEIDLRASWTDDCRPIAKYVVKALRGSATIEPLNDEGSMVKIVIPWSVMEQTHDFRTDILLLVNDGEYFSAPAYISVRHIHRLDPITRNVPAH